MRSRNGIALLALAAVLALGCASAPTSPPDWLPEADEAGTHEFGGWIEVKCEPKRGGLAIHGELLAIDSARVYVLRGDGMRSVPLDSVREARLTWFHSHGEAVGGIAALATLATISHGYFLVFTAPIWMIFGSVAAHDQYHESVVKTKPQAWAELRPYARFPQGLPPGFVPTAPVTTHIVKEPAVEIAPPPPPLPSRRLTEGGTHWGFAAGGGATHYIDTNGSGLGLVMGMNAANKWATAGVRMAVCGRDDPNDPRVPAASGQTTFFDLGLLLGARVGFGRFELAARAGPAVWGFGVEDFVDLRASFAAQGELFAYPWRNVGIGTIVAYNDNDLLDFYMVTIGIAIGPR